MGSELLRRPVVADQHQLPRPRQRAGSGAHTREESRGPIFIITPHPTLHLQTTSYGYGYGYGRPPAPSGLPVMGMVMVMVLNSAYTGPYLTTSSVSSVSCIPLMYPSDLVGRTTVLDVRLYIHNSQPTIDPSPFRSGARRRQGRSQAVPSPTSVPLARATHVHRLHAHPHSLGGLL